MENKYIHAAACIIAFAVGIFNGVLFSLFGGGQ